VEQALPDHLRVVTWNIERAVQFTAIAATLLRLDADVILLQEVDRFADRSGKRDVARDLATHLGMHWTTLGEFQEIGQGGQGRSAISNQAILSRFPITNAKAIVFARQVQWRWKLNPVQPRRGGRVALRADTAGVTFYDLHLESTGSDPVRQDQLEEVLHDDASRSSRVRIVAGDFNTGDRARQPLLQRMAAAAFADALGDATGRKTSIRHEHPIDWIFVTSGVSAAGHVEKVDGASDHYPLVATVMR